MSRWNVSKKIEEKFKPILKDYLNEIENLTFDEINKMNINDLILDLSDTGINPSQLVKLLNDLGYEETDRENSGWELNFWIYFQRKDGKIFESNCEQLVIIGCGMTFELKLCINEMI